MITFWAMPKSNSFVSFEKEILNLTSQHVLISNGWNYLIIIKEYVIQILEW